MSEPISRSSGSTNGLRIGSVAQENFAGCINAENAREGGKLPLVRSRPRGDSFAYGSPLVVLDLHSVRFFDVDFARRLKTHLKDAVSVRRFDFGLIDAIGNWNAPRE